jgi:nanoRNase/pAp phosphatase (c-di-AMP/oligoRNAs hydrolase)
MFVYDGRMFTVSVYSTNPNIDCGAICKKYGGGGHKGAAGFQCKELPFQRVS